MPLALAGLDGAARAATVDTSPAQAVPRLKGAASAATRGRARRLIIGVPSSVAAGDVLVAGVTASAGRRTRIVAPAGWTLIRRDAGGRRGRLEQALYWKTVGVREPASYAWSLSRRAGAAGGILAYAEVDGATPIAGHGGRAAAGSRRGSRAQRISAPSLRTRVANAIVVAFFGSAGRRGVAPPSGMIERYDARSRAGVTSAAADHLQARAGATGSRAARARRLRARVARIGQVVALRPQRTAAQVPPVAGPPQASAWSPEAGPQPPGAVPTLADLVPPDTAITAGPSGSTGSTSAVFGFSSTEPGSTFECRLDGGPWAACSSPKSYSGLAAGLHTFEVRAVDAAGNADPLPALREWTIDTALPPDTTPPNTTITGGPTGTTSSTSASFSFVSSEAGSTFECQLDGAAWAGCTSPQYHAGLADGSHVFRVRATDAAGNRDGSPASRTWTVSAAPPPAGLPAPLGESSGAVFHVATSGSDASPGSASQPWRTAQKALDTLQPGQRALVHAGTYTQALDLTRTCTAAAPCTLEAAPGEARPVLRATEDHVLRVEGSAGYWRVRGFTFRDSNITSGGLVDLYGHHLELSGNELTNSGDQDFYLDEESDHVQILGNWMHDSGLGRTHQSHGAYIQGDDHVLANNVVHDHPHGFGMQVYDEGLRAIVVNNTVTHNAHSGIVAGGSGGVSGVVIRNNIFAYNDDYGISWDSTCPNGSAGTTYADHNLVFGNGSGAIDPQPCSATSTAGGNRTSDPLFVSPVTRDLHLRAGSPASGYALPDWALASDHDGDSRPQGSGPDAGAFEDG